ncbi:MAG: amidohydrolase [Clostridia bacterium]|nr:amidohydrolase [Clostridia bacterium]
MRAKIESTVESYRQQILDTLDYVWKNPETGYREVKTSAYMAEAFQKLGYELTMAGNIPGFYTDIKTGKPGPTLLIMGELDSLICRDHPDADPETGAVHCCGHAAQCAALVGVAAALKNPEIASELCGTIRLCAVPAEELIEIGYRKQLRDQGIIKYMGGKPEFMHRGFFDDVDLAFMVHTTIGENFGCSKGSVGCVAKQVTYKGVSSHAGGSPWNGKNALYAASLGLNAINAIRETFKEQDIIRVHPIITSAGNAVNAIPDRAVIESFVRGSSFEAIIRENKKVNQALCGAAVSIDNNVQICDIPGYAPLTNNTDLIDVATEAVSEMFPGKELKFNDVIGSGSTDMGDISSVMPAIHPYAPGSEGFSHGSNYKIANPQLACIDSAKWQVMMAYMLLKDGAERAKKIVADFKPLFPSIKEYLAYLDSIDRDGDRITYNDDSVTISL